MATAIEGLEIDGCIVRGALLPTPREHTDPFACQGAHSGLVRVALGTLLLRVDLGPEGMPNRLCGPLHERVPEAFWTLEPPVPPGFLATPFGHWRDPGIFLQCRGGRLPFPLLPEGAEQTGSKDGARAGEGLQQRAIGRTLGALRAGLIKGRDRVQGPASLTGQGLDQQGLGSDAALISRQGRRGFDSGQALGEHVFPLDLLVAKAGLQGGPPGEVCGFEGGPATQKVTEKGRVFVLKPVQHLWERVLQGTGEAVGHAHCIADQAATVVDELFEGAPRRTLRLEPRQRVAMGEEQCELECGVRGGVLRSAGRKGFALPRQRQRLDREEDEKVILAPGRDQGAFGECEAEGTGLTAESRAEWGDPRVEGLRGVLALQALPFGSARHLETNIMFGICPVDPNTGCKGVGSRLCHTSSPRVC